MTAAIVAVCALLAVCLLALIVAAIAAVKDMRDAHTYALAQADARRVAEVALATASEGLMSAQRDMQTAENLHRAERERADFLEEQLHDQDVLLATGTPAGGGTTRERLRMALAQSAIKRVSNLAAGADRARTPSDPESIAVPHAAPARGAGDSPTRPGDQ